MTVLTKHSLLTRCSAARRAVAQRRVDRHGRRHRLRSRSRRDVIGRCARHDDVDGAALVVDAATLVARQELKE